MATRDIASSGAKLLLNKSWTGQGGLTVLGPEDLSFNDMSAIMKGVPGKAIRFQQIPSEVYKAQLMQIGANEVFAKGLATMFIAQPDGRNDSEPLTAENKTPSSFRQ